MLGQGFVKNYQALTACRTLLGFFEAGEFSELGVPTLPEPMSLRRELTNGIWVIRFLPRVCLSRILLVCEIRGSKTVSKQTA